MVRESDIEYRTNDLENNYLLIFKVSCKISDNKYKIYIVTIL